MRLGLHKKSFGPLDVWRAASSPGFGSEYVVGAIHDGTTWVATSSTTIRYSTDAETWTGVTDLIGANEGAVGIKYLNSQFVVYGGYTTGDPDYDDDARIWYSATGTSFTQTDPGGGVASISDIIWDGSNYAVMDSYGDIYYAPLLTTATWTWKDMPSAFIGAGLAYNGSSLYVTAGNLGKIYYSSSLGGTWTLASTPSFGTSAIYGVDYLNGEFIAFGASGKIGYSTDGNTWTQSSSTGTSSAILKVSRLDDIYWAVGESGAFIYSYDRDVWATVPNHGFSTTHIEDVAKSPMHYVAVGQSGKVRIVEV